ncbi:hypothetical protein V499_07842 [Pseudogymnoascus sp. VKM F-103]|uniref:Nuclear speckle splicing regulatory protein 1 N-terminal domain-containing protein n=1 Tax=Pseudogymnoascus verrucosus TaxID=342668 RepID=A0A1B8GDG4_9PEZI|nr:uncharacterized protein VE01_08478 [Pseudogymnoascus verrucosus]KFY71988.1 hypothetical protein V499_07842 [Pseudogymnoascus sp. VKM F-103]OBT93860.1 hypothetical protein VE01_08478 [Pseudogymnoascus verrucosus]
MSGNGLSYGLNITKKAKPIGFRPPPGKRKPIFDSDGDSGDDDTSKGGAAEEIGEFGGLDLPSSKPSTSKPSKPLSKPSSKPNPFSKPPTGAKPKSNTPQSLYGDLSTSFSSSKHAATAESIDSSIYDYDAVYDSLKPVKQVTEADKERKPKYMTSLLAAAAVRKRDATIAEERKLAKEREAEGEEYADKEKFVTEAYKKQQAANRIAEAEEKEREEREAKENKNTGFTGFYKDLLEKDEKRHAEIVKAAEERGKAGPEAKVEEEEGGEKSEAQIAKEINEKKSGAIAVNDEGQVVDKRQLLKGGLNIIPKAKPAAPAPRHNRDAMADRRGAAFVGTGGGKQAMRERQTRMMEAQLEEATKRAREEEEEEREKVERASKSRKTEGEIMGAKERYLLRKKEAEEAKRREAEGK